MSKEYIEREAALDLIGEKSYIGRFDGCYYDVGEELTEEINAIPAADVVEVRHGTPIRHFMRFCNSDGEVLREIMDGWECPFCHNTGAENYCPNCGAKMDGGVNDGKDD